MPYFHGKYPLKTWKFASKSQFNYWTVELWGDGAIVCDCPGFTFRKKCRHVVSVLDELTKEFGGFEKALRYYRDQKKKEQKDGLSKVSK